MDSNSAISAIYKQMGHSKGGDIGCFKRGICYKHQGCGG